MKHIINHGTKLFRTYLSTSNVIDIDISNDNRYLAIAEANFSGIVIQSNIKIISVEDAKKNSDSSIMYIHKANPGDLIINIEYNNRGNLVCMYDSYIDYIKDNKNEEVVRFSSENVLFADIHLNSSIAKILKISENTNDVKTELQIINSNIIENKRIYVIEGMPRKMHVSDNTICVNLGTEILFINSNGWLKKRYRSSQEVKEVVVSDNLAGIIYNNKIELISL